MAHTLQITFQGGQDDPSGFPRFTPGSRLAGTVQIVPASELKVSHLWIRLQWHTEGRGDRDEGRVQAVDVHQGVLAAGQPVSYAFDFTAPDQPWSFAGHYINIIWEVVVELDIPLAADVRATHPFILAPAG